MGVFISFLGKESKFSIIEKKITMGIANYIIIYFYYYL